MFGLWFSCHKPCTSTDLCADTEGNGLVSMDLVTLTVDKLCHVVFGFTRPARDSVGKQISLPFWRIASTYFGRSTTTVYLSVTLI